MKRVVWLTDIHLNFLKAAGIEAFLQHVADSRPDVLLIGGDVGEAPDVVRHLRGIGERFDCPIFFVLGNHDYYFGSIRRVRADAEELCQEQTNLMFLTAAGVCELAQGVGLVGHDGWADARLGDYERSLVMMNDYRLIEELAGVSKSERWPLLREMGDVAATHVERHLPEALKRYDRVFFLTHVPPLREACWYQGQTSNDEWLPHFTCLAVGQALLKIMREHPTRRLTVLCGHTHSPGQTNPLPNMMVLTGGAEYGHPRVQQVFEL
ncbi:MAG TPA: metallophosphoesterase [Pirellulales bacterium]|nr:metallophosphoesterase [Pirellulales bacterium]